MKHLKHSDHGALRYTVGSASVESEPPAAAAAVADGEVSGAVWEQVFSFVGDKSLSSVPLNPLTATEKALAGLCAARSRLFQVRKHGTLDFFGSDVAGVAIGGWETKLGELVSEAEQRLTARARKGACGRYWTETAPSTDLLAAERRAPRLSGAGARGLEPFLFFFAAAAREGSSAASSAADEAEAGSSCSSPSTKKA